MRIAERLSCSYFPFSSHVGGENPILHAVSSIVGELFVRAFLGDALLESEQSQEEPKRAVHLTVQERVVINSLDSFPVVQAGINTNPSEFEESLNSLAQPVLTNGQKIVDTALTLIGRFNWCSSSGGRFSYSDPVEGLIANDFSIFFSPGRAVVPKYIQDAVKQKYLNAVNTEIVPTRENQMRMCCWEFCVFVLFQAGLVSSEKIARLLTFIPNRIKELPDALAQSPFSQYREVTVDDPAQPGDLLLFVRNRDYYPWHAAICLKDHTFIELMYGWTDKRFDPSVKQIEIYFKNTEKALS